jgi:hypothetical protein
MKVPRLKLWWLCLAVAVSAVVIKLALSVNVIMMVNTPLLFLGPISGIVLDRQRGGTGIAGGVIAGILTGLVLSTLINIFMFRLGRPFVWYEWAVSTTFFVILETFCGWHWGRSFRSWHLAMAKIKAAKSEVNEI